MTSESPLRSSFLCFCISDDFRIVLEIILPLAILKSSEIHKQGKDDLKGNSEVI
jgi:hypothetical protein